MAEIWLSPDYTAVGTDQVYLQITGGYNLPNLLIDSETKKYSNIEQTYDFNFYTDSGKQTKIITITGKQGNDGEINATLYGLTKGAANYIDVYIKYSCKVKEYKNDDWEEYDKSSTHLYGSLWVYTRNDKTSSNFWGNPQPENYIDQHITQSNVNAWLDQLGIWTSWKEQYNYYTTYDFLKDPSGDITASWYNRLSYYCGGSYTVSQFNEYIRAEHFQDLARKVTDWS